LIVCTKPMAVAAARQRGQGQNAPEAKQAGFFRYSGYRDRKVVGGKEQEPKRQRTGDMDDAEVPRLHRELRQERDSIPVQSEIDTPLSAIMWKAA
jgi:hypothetical protein